MCFFDPSKHVLSKIYGMLVDEVDTHIYSIYDLESNLNTQISPQKNIHILSQGQSLQLFPREKTIMQQFSMNATLQFQNSYNPKMQKKDNSPLPTSALISLLLGFISIQIITFMTFLSAARQLTPLLWKLTTTLPLTLWVGTMNYIMMMEEPSTADQESP